jgi:hypothetical protein
MSDVDNCTRTCACGMQRGKHQVARLRCADGSLDRFKVAHFTDEDHVRVGTQGAAQRFGETGDVHAHFALIDDRLLVIVVILDRILDSDDVSIEVHVDVIEHRR